MDMESIEYFRSREAVERAAAKEATTAHARWIHQELAQGYAALVRRGAGENPAVTMRAELSAL